MEIGTNDTVHSVSFRYMVNNGFLGGLLRSESASIFAFINAIFTAALIVKASPRDPWGNVKVPRIGFYEENGLEKDSEGCYLIRERDKNTDIYTSIIGIPIAGINDSNFVDYKLCVHLSYLGLNCSLDQTMFNHSLWGDLIKNDSNLITANGVQILYNNMTRDAVPPDSLRPLSFIYRPVYGADYSLECSIANAYVETEISCHTTSTCAATRIHRCTLDHLPPVWTLLNIYDKNWELLIENMIKSYISRPNRATILDQYLGNPGPAGRQDIYLPSTSVQNYSVRLGQLINAYFTTLNDMYAVNGGITNDTAYFWDNNPTFVPNRTATSKELFFSTSENVLLKTKTWLSHGTRITSIQVILANKYWMVVLCIVSILLILLSLISPFFYYFFIKGLDVAINLLSLATRDNVHILLPDSRTYMDASDRAKAFRNVEVRFGDVHGKTGIGYLAIGSNNTGALSVARIYRGCLYK